MPIKPKPFIVYCPTCGWKKYIAPQGDVLKLDDDFYQVCPKCQSELEITARSLTGIQKILAVWGRLLSDKVG